jgi:hypothetical protein
MSGKRSPLLLAPIATALTLCGCGHAGAGHPPALSGMPLVGGAKIVSAAKQCDRGANAYCALELVVVDTRYETSEDLRAAEHLVLGSRGWSRTGGDTGQESAADSPQNKVRLTYATADGDLRGVDLGWIQRSRKTTLALSREIFDRAPTISLMLETGAS